MKVAIVCDWLVSVGGAERVLRSVCDMFPDAPIYTSQYNKRGIDWFKDRDVHVGWLQAIPSCFRRFIGPLRQSYFDHLDLSDYDLIISVTGAEAKSVKKGNAVHVSYCHVPTQYYWGLKEDYLENPGFGILSPLARVGLKALLPRLKKADYEAAQRPDEFVTISTYAKDQIKNAYKREATIIHPPVAVEKFSTKTFSTSRETIKLQKSQAKKPEQTIDNKTIKQQKSQINSKNVSVKSKMRSGGFITTSRQVTWKRLDLAVKACLKMRVPLTIIGEGPEHNNLVKLAGGSELITFVPLTDQKGLKSYLEQAEGFIFPSLEPFGIAPVEALACGCPVIAYGKGGALDYIKDGKNGVLFKEQSVNSLCEALKRFDSLKFDEATVRNSALPFSEANFQRKLKAFVLKKVKENKVQKKQVREEHNVKKSQTEKLRLLLLYSFPFALFCSYYPLIRLVPSDSANYELSLPLIWLFLFSILSLKDFFQTIYAVLRRFVHKKTIKNAIPFAPLLFPTYLTATIFWSSNLPRAILTTGVFWCLVISSTVIIAIFRKKALINKNRLLRTIIVSATVFSIVCWLQSMLDVFGVGRETTLLCSGCTSYSFGFPHPSGFAIEPQFMGNLLLAPTILCLYYWIKSKTEEAILDHPALSILSFFLLSTLFLTFSRGAIYSFGVSIIVLIILNIVKNKSFIWLKTIPLILVSFLFTLLMQGLFSDASYTNSTFLSGIDNVVSQLSLGKIELNLEQKSGAEQEDASLQPTTDSPIFDGYVEESTNTRLELNNIAIELSRESAEKTLIGYGIGSAGKTMYEKGKTTSSLEIVQNEYLSLLLETGLIGVILACLSGVIILTKIRVFARPERYVMGSIVLSFLLSLMFFSGLPNALHIYLFLVFIAASLPISSKLSSRR